MNVFAELQHLYAIDGNLGGTAHHVEEADPHMAGKTLVDQLKSWHAAPDNPILG